MELSEIITKLEKAFEREDVKKAVLLPEWYKKNKDSGIHSTGFCYTASEVIYRLNGESEVWKKVVISENKWKEHGGHCYLENKKTNERLDITSDQYEAQNISIPYEIGIGTGFYPIRPKSKARILAEMAGLGDIMKK